MILDKKSMKHLQHLIDCDYAYVKVKDKFEEASNHGIKVDKLIFNEKENLFIVNDLWEIIV